LVLEELLLFPHRGKYCSLERVAISLLVGLYSLNSDYSNSARIETS